MLSSLKRVDVLFYLLKITIFRGIFNGIEEDVRKEVEGAQGVLDDVIVNTHKHSGILYLTIVGTLLVLRDITGLSHDELMVMLTIVMPIAAIMGVSWYVITFGAIPVKYLDVAMWLTLFMCFAFIQSLAILALVLNIVLPTGTALVVSATIFAVYVASVLYDTMDLLKAGIDEQALIFYRRAEGFLARQDAGSGASLDQVTKVLEEIRDKLP